MAKYLFFSTSCQFGSDISEKYGYLCRWSKWGKQCLISFHFPQEYSSVVDIYNTTTSTWVSSSLSQPRSNLAATSIRNLALFAGGFTGVGISEKVVYYPQGNYSAVVNIYDSVSGKWTIASLSQARANLTATTVGNLALFAGGQDGVTFD
jgi:hypothetical protein